MISKSFLRYRVRMSGWLNILIMYINTNKLSIQNSLICCRLFGITSNNMNTWKYSVKFWGRQKWRGWQNYQGWVEAHGKQQWTMQELLGTGKMSTCALIHQLSSTAALQRESQRAHRYPADGSGTQSSWVNILAQQQGQHHHLPI